MKKDEIKIGGTYLAKVTDKVVPVRLDKENPHGGWDATNLATNKKVRIKSAQRLRPRNGPAPSRENLKAQHPRKQADQENARLRDERQVSTDGMTASERAMARSEQATKPRATKPSKRTGPSLIQAAIQVLGEHKEPMTCTQMVEAILQQKLWSSTGKTPAQTLYSAILRDIQKKGSDARFTHVARGQFQLTTAPGIPGTSGTPGTPEKPAKKEA